MTTMGHRRWVQSSFLSKFGEEIHLGKDRKRLPFKRLALRLEQFEPRLLMDGAGFVNTNPREDPGLVVSVAGVEAQDDYYEVNAAAEQIRFDVLANDPQPVAGDGLRIKSVSETARGAVVSISDDGQRIIYTPGLERFADSFYYIAEDTVGNLGKANVNVEFDEVGTSLAPRVRRSIIITVYEDGPRRNLDVLGSHDEGEIVQVRALSSLGSSIEIAQDGKSLVHQPAPGVTGSELYEYTVDTHAGSTETFRANISIIKPFDTTPDWITRVIRPGDYTLDVLSNDRLLADTPEQPRIVQVSETEGGMLTISEDGQRLRFDPAANYLGQSTFTYTVQYGPRDYQRVEQSATVEIRNSFLAVDDWYSIPADSGGTLLEVWKNDQFLYGPEAMLAIVEVSTGSQGGSITLENAQAIRYTPGAGFVGEETFTYIVEDADGYRDSATVTLHVTADTPTGQGVAKFTSSGELEQFLIEQAVARYGFQFGVSQTNAWPVYNMRYDEVVAFGSVAEANVTTALSMTNTQEAGVDEADITETDGRYIYTFADGKLAIVDLFDPSNPTVVSLTEFGDNYTEMYLQGDRLTLIHRGGYSGGWCGTGFDSMIAPYRSSAVVTVLDLSDRSAPTVVERTEIDGMIVDSRAVGDQVYFTVSGLNLPPLELRPLATNGAADADSMRYETLDEYFARVRETLISEALPTYRSFDGNGTLIASGLLTDPSMIHKPVTEVDNALLSLVTFDVGDDQVGPLASAGIFTSAAAEVYMSGDSYYVMRSDQHETTIFKFSIDNDGTPTLVATGKVNGSLLNQFSVDEHEGQFRIATTETITETFFDRYGNERTRQRERVNHLFVLEQNGATLDVVGSVENLAPTETIKSVRFMDDVAYVVTFRVIDPLFVIDLSDATNPTVTGSIKIPGYSDYLQPLGESYLLGIGRDANEITGELGSLQVSLFYVGDMSHPTLVDQVTMEGAMWSSSEAWWDHHAVSYFEESQVLALPVSWYEGLDYNDYHSAIWTFQIDVDQQGGGSLSTTGNVEHDTQARRSVLLGTSLVTISQGYLRVNNLNDLDEQLAVVEFGQIPVGQHVPGGDKSHTDEPIMVVCYGDPNVSQDPGPIGTPVAEGELTLSGWEGFLRGAPPADSITLQEQEAAIDPRLLPLLLEEELNVGLPFSPAGNDFEPPTKAEGTHFSAESAIDAAFQEWELATELLEGIPAEFPCL